MHGRPLAMKMAASLRAKGVSTDLIMEDGKKSKWWVHARFPPDHIFPAEISCVNFVVLGMKSVACYLWCALVRVIFQLFPVAFLRWW